MTDTARVLLTAAILSLSAAARFTFKLRGLDDTDPERLIGQLRLARGGAILLACMGGLRIGLAVAHDGVPVANLNLFFGIVGVLMASTVLSFPPRQALRLSAAGFLVFAMVEAAHWISAGSASLSPGWLLVGSATYDLGAAAVCLWATQR